MRRRIKSIGEIIHRWVYGWLYHYKVKVPYAKLPEEISKAIEEEERVKFRTNLTYAVAHAIAVVHLAELASRGVE